jgi:hypothetical protein
MAEDKKTVDPTLTGFYEAMERTNVKKSLMKCWLGYLGIPVTASMWRVIMKMPKIGPGGQVMLFLGNQLFKQGHSEPMKGKYFHDISIVRAEGENIIPLPKAHEVVVFKSFMKARLRFPLHKMLVEVLKTFEMYLHQLTPEALIRVGIFIWAMKKLRARARC